LPYPAWRTLQDSAVVDAVDDPSRFVAHVCPTGFGKSLVYVAMSILRGGRTLILTSTKGLQSQLLKDFSCVGLVDVRGRNSYKCVLDPDSRCDSGPCVAGVRCAHKDGGCPYYDAVNKAKLSPLVVTNYAYWITMNRYGDQDSLGSFSTIVLDEAHNAPSIIAGQLSVTLDRGEGVIAQFLPFKDSNSLDEWRSWARHLLPQLDEKLVGAKQAAKSNSRAVRPYIKLKVFYSDVKTVASMGNDWVTEVYHPYKKSTTITFSPIWPGPYCGRYIYLDIPHVFITSATVRKKTLELLGVKNGDSMGVTFKEYPHSFPVQNRLVTHIPTIRMNFRTSEVGIRTWLTRIDQIVGARLDRKGIIHTVSYSRRDKVMLNSKYAEIMCSHKRTDVEVAVTQFKESPPPKILVSPSMTTGWDFPYDSCYFQIIGKIPYPDTRGEIQQARTKQDPHYQSYVAMQTLVQIAGRGVRAEDDKCETLVVDDNMLWFISRYKEFAPKWFHDAVRFSRVIPSPIEI